MRRKWVRRLLVVALAVLVVGACCYWSGVWWYSPPLVQMWANHLDRVKGKAELIVSAQRYPGRGRVSPDGRKMLVPFRNPRGFSGWVIFDLDTGTERVVNLEISDTCWLDANHFAVQDGFDYYVVDARDLSVIKLERFPKEEYMWPGGFRVVEPLLKEADQVYALRGWGSDYKFFVLTKERHYLVPLSSYEFGITNEELDALVAEIPHVDVPRLGWWRPLRTGTPVYSPDGRFYATEEATDKGFQLAIYSQAGRLVALAYKAGWNPYFLGWAHDSSGVYFSIRIDGSTAAVLVPYRPLFKLSPLTEEEARRAAILCVVKWVGVGLALAGVGWWMWKRRQQ